MKHLKILMMLGLSLYLTFTSLSFNEEEAVTKVTKQYIENFFLNNTEEMSSALHTDLYKHGFELNRKDLTNLYTLDKLKKMLSKKRALPLKHQKNIVKVLDVYGNAASVRLETGYPKMRWVEYLHLAKLNGEWKIVNVFWDYSKDNKAGKKKAKN